MDNSKVQRQLELEQESVNLGIKQYREAVRKNSKDKVTELPSGLRLLTNAMQPTIKAFQEFFINRTAVGHLAHTKTKMQQFTSEELAYMTAHSVINSITRAAPLQKIAVDLGTNLEDHLNYKTFKHEQPGYLKVVEKNLKTGNVHHRKTVLTRARNKVMGKPHHWAEVEKLHLGTKCIEIFIEATGLVEITKFGEMFTLKPSEKALEWLEKQNAKCELMNPIFMPMIIPPRDWTDCYNGGFITNEITVTQKLVKTRDNEALNALNQREMPEVYKAINALQSTPWKINHKVYEVLKEVWEGGDCLGGLPGREIDELPVKPWSSDTEFVLMKEQQPERVKAWKVAATKVYTERVRSVSKRLAMIQKIWIAEKFVDEEEIFFCWNMDWRGRMYPVQSYVNPQADDVGKALIEFKHGVALGNRGAWWLKVHLANTFGYDKVSFEDRVKWTEEHHEQILDSAENPLDGVRFWTEADEPYMFLAAAFDYAGLVKEGTSHVSHLPIGQDGSCNGLQNFSAMLKDEIGGAAVNILPSEKPSDIYGIVAKKVAEYVEQDAAAGNEDARAWVGKIDRKIAKRNVMTYVYGARKYGFKEQLMKELQDRDDALKKEGKASYLNTQDNYGPAVYLAGKMYDTIGEVVVAAKHAMDWLQEVAKVAADADCPISWTTPIGFAPRQHYRKASLIRIDTVWGKVRLVLGLLRDTTKLNTLKQQNGIAPNFVHSLDASHLMKTINRLYDEGIMDFAMIHDSYGTHAAYIDILSTVLRETFIEQYSEDILSKFREEVIAQLPAEVADQIPAVPAKGNLDITEVRDSRYFFA